MDDNSPMLFGKYRGEKMEDVPARYLLWLWDEGLYRETRPDRQALRGYISSNFSALETEAKDYIVQNRPS